MSRAKVYLRIAKTSRGYKYAATSKPSTAPLMNGYDPLPTIAFSFVVQLPEYAFDIPLVGELNVPLDALQPCVEIEP
jgi:hypothetical protein